MSDVTVDKTSVARLNVARGRRLRSFEELGVLMVLIGMVAVVSAFHPEFLNAAAPGSTKL